MQNFNWKLRSFVDDKFLTEAYVTGESYERLNVVKGGLCSLSVSKLIM